MPLVRHIYNAFKQISAAIPPDQNTQAFEEVAIIRHPRIGEYAFGFISSSVVLQTFYKVVRSWAPKKFMARCVILFPIAITYITWWFIHFVDGFFSPIYAQLGIDVFDTTSMPKNQKINISKEQKKNQMKKQRHVAEPEAATPVAEQFGEGEGEEVKIIDISCEDDCTEIRIITTIADDLAMEHEVNASANNTGEDCKQSKRCSGDDILMLKSEHEIATIPAKEAHDSINCCETDHKPDKEGSELKYLLLTNQSFISNAEELLNLDLDYPKILPKNETNEIANVRLYLDCANELTERKSLQESQVVRPLLLTYDAGNSRLHISLGKLVEEIYNAIKNLTCYSEKSGKKLGSSDSIYAMTERDMKCNGLINGIWNWGWRHGFSADEAEQVVNEVENLVFSELIEEVIVNL